MQVVGAEELLRLRDEVATWMAKYDGAADALAEARHGCVCVTVCVGGVAGVVAA